MVEKLKQTASMLFFTTSAENQPSPELLDQWLKEAKTGTEAFDHIYNYFFPKMYNFIFYRVGNQETAEDMTADTFVKIISKFDTFEGDYQAFTAWIYRIARNLITDYYRQAKRKAQVYFMATPVLTTLIEKNEHEKSPHERVEMQDQLSLVRKAINLLKPIEQELITLKFFEGLHNNTIAEIINVKPGTLNVRLHRVVDKLKELVQQQQQFAHA